MFYVMYKYVYIYLSINGKKNKSLLNVSEGHENLLRD